MTIGIALTSFFCIAHADTTMTLTVTIGTIKSWWTNCRKLSYYFQKHFVQKITLYLLRLQSPLSPPSYIAHVCQFWFWEKKEKEKKNFKIKFYVYRYYVKVEDYYSLIVRSVYLTRQNLSAGALFNHNSLHGSVKYADINLYTIILRNLNRYHYGRIAAKTNVRSCNFHLENYTTMNEVINLNLNLRKSVLSLQCQLHTNLGCN